jgi:hypothetical protein
MRMGNQWYDRLVAALSRPTRREREAAVAEFERDVKKMELESEAWLQVVLRGQDFDFIWKLRTDEREKAAVDAKDLLRALLRHISSAGSLRRGLGRQIGQFYLGLLLPALSTAVHAEDRNTANESMVPVVFALAAYRADHGIYPAALTALVPKYLPAIPEDLFSGGPIRYKREGQGYVVYSVGINRKDDGGRTFGEGAEGQVCDDFVIRVPGKRQ